MAKRQINATEAAKPSHKPIKKQDLSLSDTPSDASKTPEKPKNSRLRWTNQRGPTKSLDFRWRIDFRPVMAARIAVRLVPDPNRQIGLATLANRFPLFRCPHRSYLIARVCKNEQNSHSEKLIRI
jgi:hypothetical protein